MGINMSSNMVYIDIDIYIYIKYHQHQQHCIKHTFPVFLSTSQSQLGIAKKQFPSNDRTTLGTRPHEAAPEEPTRLPRPGNLPAMKIFNEHCPGKGRLTSVK